MIGKLSRYKGYRRYYEKNKEDILERQRLYYEEHKKEILEKNRLKRLAKENILQEIVRNKRARLFKSL